MIPILDIDPRTYNLRQGDRETRSKDSFLLVTLSPPHLVSALHPRHEAQAINYLTATGFRLAILLNPSTGLRACFGASSLKHQRMVK